MSASRLAWAVAIAVMMTAPALVLASGQEKNNTATKRAPAVSSKTVPASSMATLKGVKAAPMSSSELADVKGTHVHFLDGNGGFHLAGNPEGGQGTKNWYDNGNATNTLVAPSYHGLCVAQGVGVGGIRIPGAAAQC